MGNIGGKSVSFLSGQIFEVFTQLLSQIVREQCWLNENLKLCSWTANTPYIDAHEDADDAGATDEELNSILEGVMHNYFLFFPPLSSDFFTRPLILFPHYS